MVSIVVPFFETPPDLFDLCRQRADPLSASAGVEEDREARQRLIEWVIGYVGRFGVGHPDVGPAAVEISRP